MRILRVYFSTVGNHKTGPHVIDSKPIYILETSELADLEQLFILLVRVKIKSRVGGVDGKQKQNSKNNFMRRYLEIICQS